MTRAMARKSKSAPTTDAAVLVPKVTPKRFFGLGLPGVEVEKLSGKLIVVEGADGSGRSTQIARLIQWLEASGHHTVQVGLKRSSLVSEELEAAQQGNILSRTTLSLFYATDFADQLENTILPALRAVGYRQAWEFLDGASTAAEFRERAIAATRQLAKRQFTWLRGELDARWFDPVTRRTPLDAAIAGFLGE